MSKETLKEQINADITTNGLQQITGAKLNSILNNVVDEMAIGGGVIEEGNTQAVSGGEVYESEKTVVFDVNKETNTEKYTFMYTAVNSIPSYFRMIEKNIYQVYDGVDTILFKMPKVNYDSWAGYKILNYKQGIVSKDKIENNFNNALDFININRNVSIDVILTDKNINASSVLFHGSTMNTNVAQLTFMIDQTAVTITPKTPSPFSVETLEDKIVVYEVNNIGFNLIIKVNWKKLYDFTVSRNIRSVIPIENIKYQSISQYPFLQKSFNTKTINNGIKDIYIPTIDEGYRYFIRTLNITTAHSTYQIVISKTNKEDATTSADFTNVASFIISKSSVPSENINKNLVFTNNGVSILVNFQELINANTNWEFTSGQINPFSAPDMMQIDLVDINNQSYFKFNLKQDKLVSGGNIKTINGQSILGAGDLQAAESITNNPDNITIEQNSNVLRLKEITGNSSISKLGTIYVYDDITLTQAIANSWASRIVEIKGTVTLTGSSNISIPATAVLHFVGGKFLGSNFSGILYASNARIIAPAYQIFEGAIGIAHKMSTTGTESPFTVYGSAYPEWFGAKGNGINDDADAINSVFDCIRSSEVILSRRKTYIIGKTISIHSSKLVGNGATVKRKNKFASSPNAQPINALSSGTHTVVVDDASGFEIGQGVFLLNNGGSRKVDAGRWTVTNIVGNSITMRGNSMATSYAVAEMQLVVGFPMISLSGDNPQLDGLTINGSFDINYSVFPADKTPWEVYNCVHYGGYNAIVSNNIITNAPAEGIMGGGFNSLIFHNIVKHCGGNGLHLSGHYSGGVSENYFFDTNINPLTSHNEGAITYSNQISNVTIKSNVFDNCRNGIGSIDSPDNCKSIIIDNTFKNYREHGVQGVAVTTANGSITADFIIKNNKFYGKISNTSSWENTYELIPLVPRQDSTGYAVFFNGSGVNSWEDLIINGNIFKDSSVYIKNAKNLNLSANTFNMKKVFAGTTPSNIIELINCKGTAKINTIMSNTSSKTNCFVLTDSKVSVQQNDYDLTDCTLSDVIYPLLTNNTDIT